MPSNSSANDDLQESLYIKLSKPPQEMTDEDFEEVIRIMQQARERWLVDTSRKGKSSRKGIAARKVSSSAMDQLMKSIDIDNLT